MSFLRVSVPPENLISANKVIPEEPYYAQFI